MSVAFIVPAYNAQATLATTLSSLLLQESSDWSAVVIDDGSTDRTREIAEGSGDARIRVFSQQNKGLSSARNAGVGYVLDRHLADLVCFLDADDCVAPGYVGRMTDAIGGADLAPCAFRMVGERLEDVGWTVVPSHHDFALDRMVHVNPIAPGAVLVRLSSMQRLGLFTNGCLFDESLRSAEDWDLWLRASAADAHWADVVREPQFAYRMRKGSMSDALRTMHDASACVIRRCDSPQRGDALRGLHLRTAARAVAAQDRVLAHEHLATIGPLDQRDVGVLVGAIRYAFMFAHCTGPTFADRYWPQWRATIEDVLSEADVLPELLARLAFNTDQIPRAARALLEQLSDDQVPVIYGVGHNGRALIDEIIRLDPNAQLAWIDDGIDDGVGPSDPLPHEQLGPRLTIDELDAHHLVVVTPDENSGILRLLAESLARSVTDSAARVETIASLAMGQPA